MEETGLSLRTFHNLLLVLAQLPLPLVLMMHQLFIGMRSYPRNLHVHVLGQSYWSPPHNLSQLQTAPDTPSSIFMQGQKGGPYKFMQVFNGSGRRATQFRM